MYSITDRARGSFFSQLVDALGPQGFLAPICMLLVDKVANRVVRQNDADALHSLGLPLILMQRYDLSVQLSVCGSLFFFLDVLLEC